MGRGAFSKAKGEGWGERKKKKRNQNPFCISTRLLPWVGGQNKAVWPGVSGCPLRRSLSTLLETLKDSKERGD